MKLSKFLIISQVHLFSEGFSPPYNFRCGSESFENDHKLKLALMSQDILDNWIASLLSTRSSRDIAKLVYVGQDRVRAV
jgi:hypothetical protein